MPRGQEQTPVPAGGEGGSGWWPVMPALQAPTGVPGEGAEVLNCQQLLRQPLRSGLEVGDRGGGREPLAPVEPRLHPPLRPVFSQHLASQGG